MSRRIASVRRIWDNRDRTISRYFIERIFTVRGYCLNQCYTLQRCKRRHLVASVLDGLDSSSDSFTIY